MGFVTSLSMTNNITEYSALMSKVMSNGTVESNSQSTNLLKERKNHKFKSTWIFTEVQVQHIASLPDDIMKTNDLRSRGIEFLSAHHILIMMQYRSD
jgi:4-hydroxyphenylpyruvate dioxygenase-like putative hemolysin